MNIELVSGVWVTTGDSCFVLDAYCVHPR